MMNMPWRPSASGLLLVSAFAGLAGCPSEPAPLASSTNDETEESEGDPGDGDGEPGDGDGEPGDGDGDGDGDMCIDDNGCDQLDSECAQGICDDGTCTIGPSNEGGACSTPNLCTIGTCSAGVCVQQDVDCSGLDGECMVGVCNVDTGQCSAQPGKEGMPCVGAMGCYDAATCNQGTCEDPDGGFIFYEDFADNDAGWILSDPWEIGPAQGGCLDPAMDHGPTDDNGLAGVAIGSCLPGDVLLYRCVWSPTVDTSGLPSLWLTYYRNLNSNHIEADSFLNNLEIFDGRSWVILYTGAEAPDQSWVYQSFDIAPYANADMRVRWCYQILNPDYVLALGGWSIDDVTIATGECNGADP
jgi:hypothetical protein